MLIGEDVTYLGNFALVGCTALTEMDIPDNVTALGTNLFRDCTALVKVGFGSGVTAFSNYLFYGCTSLGNMEIPSHVTTIGKNAFYGCKGLTEMTVPDTVTSMGERAFCGCTSLKKITMGKNMTSFSNELFYGCSSLTEVVFPEGMVSLGQHTFYKCTSLTAIKIPEVKEIGKFTFAYCSALTEVIIPDSVTAIGTYAFTGCTALKTIRLPEGITVLSGGIFDDCTALAEITIPEKVTSIDAYAFKGCASLSDVTFEGDAPKINYNSFYKVTATCYYPADNETWTADVRKDYGGTLTWEVLSEPGPTPVTVTISPEKLSLNLESEVHVNVDATITVSDWDRVVEIGLMTWYTRTDNANDATIVNVDVVTPGCTLLDNGYYRVRSQGIPAKNMADDVWYKVYVKLDDGSYVYSARMKYSPKMYSNTILGDDSYSDEMKALCVALMNYGAEAQTFFADKGQYTIPTVNGVETLMNADISAEDQARVKAFDAAMLDERLTADSSKHGEFTTSSLYKTYSMFLSLEGAITLNYNILHNAPAGSVTDCGMLIWTEEDYAEATTLTWENASAQIDGVISDGCFTTAYTGNAAKNMGDTVYACAYMEVDGEYHYIVFRSSVDYFVENIIKSNSQTELMKSLAQHLAVYGEYAAAYFASK